MCKTGDVADPLVVVVGGPNGAGKSTTAPRLLRGALAVREFVNADAIAHGLSAFRPETVAFAAGRVMLARLRALAASRSRRRWRAAISRPG
jgi:predicted ABC-type ATPase